MLEKLIESGVDMNIDSNLDEFLKIFIEFPDLGKKYLILKKKTFGEIGMNNGHRLQYVKISIVCDDLDSFSLLINSYKSGHYADKNTNVKEHNRYLFLLSSFVKPLLKSIKEKKRVESYLNNFTFEDLDTFLLTDPEFCKYVSLDYIKNGISVKDIINNPIFTISKGLEMFSKISELDKDPNSLKEFIEALLLSNIEISKYDWFLIESELNKQGINAVEFLFNVIEKYGIHTPLSNGVKIQTNLGCFHYFKNKGLELEHIPLNDSYHGKIILSLKLHRYEDAFLFSEEFNDFSLFNEALSQATEDKHKLKLGLIAGRKDISILKGVLENLSKESHLEPCFSGDRDIFKLEPSYLLDVMDLCMSLSQFGAVLILYLENQKTCNDEHLEKFKKAYKENIDKSYEYSYFW